MDIVEEVCTGVVDGGMLLAGESRFLVLARVRPPRVGIPGGAVLRMLAQRLVQDQTIRVQPVGKDAYGHEVVEVWIGDRNLNDYILHQIRERGYGDD